VVSLPSLPRTVTEPSGSAGTGSPSPKKGGRTMTEAVIVLAVTLLVALLVIDRHSRG
jgi:hypothetical protein